MSEKQRRIDDVPKLTDKELDDRIADWMKDLAEVTSTILKDGIQMLLLEKQNRTARSLERSSNRLEIATWVLVALTVVLAILTVVLICRA